MGELRFTGTRATRRRQGSLDVGWKGSNKDEKAKGMQVAKACWIKCHVEVLEEGVNDGPDIATNFWNHIKSEKGKTSRH
jgi:hypothetical protein